MGDRLSGIGSDRSSQIPVATNEVFEREFSVANEDRGASSLSSVQDENAQGSSVFDSVRAWFQLKWHELVNLFKRLFSPCFKEKPASQETQRSSAFGNEPVSTSLNELGPSVGLKIEEPADSSESLSNSQESVHLEEGVFDKPSDLGLSLLFSTDSDEVQPEESIPEATSTWDVKNVAPSPPIHDAEKQDDLPTESGTKKEASSSKESDENSGVFDTPDLILETPIELSPSLSQLPLRSESPLQKEQEETYREKVGLEMHEDRLQGILQKQPGWSGEKVKVLSMSRQKNSEWNAYQSGDISFAQEKDPIVEAPSTLQKEISSVLVSFDKPSDSELPPHSSTVPVEVQSEDPVAELSALLHDFDQLVSTPIHTASAGQPISRSPSESSLEAATALFEKALQKLVTLKPNVPNITSTPPELMRLIQQANKMPTTNSLWEVKDQFDIWMEGVAKGNCNLSERGTSGSSVSNSMWAFDEGEAGGADRKFTRAGNNLIQCFINWLNCLDTPEAHPLILEIRKGQIWKVLEAYIGQVQTASNKVIQEGLKPLILGHIEAIKISADPVADFSFHVTQIQPSLQALNVRAPKETEQSMLAGVGGSVEDTHRRKEKLMYINSLFVEIAPLFGLSETQAPYIYIDGVNQSEHAFHQERKQSLPS